MSVTRFFGVIIFLVASLFGLLIGGCAIAGLFSAGDRGRLADLFVIMSIPFGCFLLAYGGWKMMWEKNKKKPPIIEGHENDH